ncbi:inositol monophosphatase family protein [Conexibacter sp. SYSU D00693]|uniref:inositol monophosphatase family protein n=1 Tax=Conexibacter sp. SYSU D00693 TaxID=2812560 RepID=UPI00196B2929|nr:inositol monophosphatase family protein [Conexibacter sp. SYSU D00693]
MEDDQLAVALADAADAVTVAHFAHAAPAAGVVHKADRSPVTAADHEAEAALRGLLARHRPDDAVLGEEQGGADDRPARLWLLDPVDGTLSFARGIPVWGTLVALERDGVPVLGMVSAPVLGRRWRTTRDGVVTRLPDGTERPARVSAATTLDGALAGCSNPGGLGDPERRAAVVALGDRAQWVAGFESFWGPVLVAEGALDVAVLPEGERWDVAPLRALVEAAGGRCTALDFGARTGRTGAVFSAPGVHDELLAALGAAG